MVSMKYEMELFKIEYNKNTVVKCNGWLFIIPFVLVFFSCSPKIYQKGDYTFYNKAFSLDSSSLLRTDGVYVLHRIWTDENGGTVKQPQNHLFYKFYNTGQCNLTVDLSNEIKTEKEYQNTISKDLEKQNNTLFQGYYKISQPKIIIQSRVTPRGLFEYKYGYIEKDTLIIVKSTIEGKGGFDTKYYTGYYKEYYVFVPLQIQNEGEPQW